MLKAWRTTVVVVCTLVVAAGCSLVAQPDVAAWDGKARQAAADAASEVATVRLALDTARADRAWASYTQVLVADAEKALATVQDDMARLQVPSGREDDAADLTELLDGAAGAVRAARQDVVEGRYDDPRLLDELARAGDRLTRAEDQW